MNQELRNIERPWSVSNHSNTRSPAIADNSRDACTSVPQFLYKQRGFCL